MSGPFQRPPLHSSNSSTSSPLSPGGGDTPVSFRTNVNRAKTKRWVEAKKYTYDGDDWGEDEYGEYEYDDEPPVPQLQQPGANRSNPDISSISKGSSHPPLPSMDRSRSMEHTQTESAGNPASPSSPETPIVRPAEIYKRMREEQKATSATEPPTSSVGAEPSETTAPLSVQADADTSVIPPATANEPPTLSLPDVKRLSGFGSNLLTDSDSNPQINQDVPNQQHQLQHNPSLGFRSAVNQAFDVPETPSTIADSVARSNSDSTTGISPIIARQGTTDDKTPTIHEEPNENAETPTEAGIVFKPGHRRDLSIPSPGNSPSRRPQLVGPDTSVSSELAQLSGATPAESPLDHPQSARQELPHPDTALPSRETPVRDLPPPLNVQTSIAPGPGVSTENIPLIIPSMSSENSPEDTENDRLRKEIIRSLSRENTPSDHQDNDTPPQTSGQDTLFPHKGGLSTVAPQAEPASSMSNAVPATSGPSIEEPTPISAQNTQPKLKKRFSWEDSSDEEDPTLVTQSQPARPMPGQFPFSQENVHPDSEATPTNEPSKTLGEAGSRDDPENAGLTVLPPLATDTTDISSSGPGYEPTLSEALAQAEEEESHSPKHQNLGLSAPISSTSIESGLLGFKDILGKQSPYERIQAFDRTRDQFAAIDTGLSNWVQVTLYAHPEHADVVERNSKPLSDEFKNSLPRAKFPKLTSLGNLASSLQDGSHSTSGHVRRSSTTLGSVRQNQAGKDFLHTAGVLGGHAGKAAKGLFSKGRSKLKGVGGSEKVEP